MLSITANTQILFSCFMPTTEVMNVGVYVCIILAALSCSTLSLPSLSMRARREVLITETPPAPSANHTRQARSAPAGQLSLHSPHRGAADVSDSLGQLLAGLLPRKGSQFQSRSSLSSRAVSPGHRIKDRDYIGWMDFGRRSAEEYEYSPEM